MSTETAQAIAERSVAAFLAADTNARELRITTSHVAPGHVRAHLTITEGMLNGHGTAHGAAIFALADIAFALACNSYGHLEIGRSCAIEYLAAARIGDELIAEAVFRSRAGRSAIYDVAITRASDAALIAEFRGHSREIAARPGATPEA